MKQRKRVLLGVGIVVALGLGACLLTYPPGAQRIAASKPDFNAANDRTLFVPISRYNKLVQAETQLALALSNLQAAAVQQSRDLTNLYAKMTEFDLRANGQETGTRTLTESCSLLNEPVANARPRGGAPTSRDQAQFGGAGIAGRTQACAPELPELKCCRILLETAPRTHAGSALPPASPQETQRNGAKRMKPAL